MNALYACRERSGDRRWSCFRRAGSAYLRAVICQARALAARGEPDRAFDELTRASLLFRGRLSSLAGMSESLHRELLSLAPEVWRSIEAEALEQHHTLALRRANFTCAAWISDEARCPFQAKIDAVSQRWSDYHREKAASLEDRLPGAAMLHACAVDDRPACERLSHRVEQIARICPLRVTATTHPEAGEACPSPLPAFERLWAWNDEPGIHGALPVEVVTDSCEVEETTRAVPGQCRFRLDLSSRAGRFEPTGATSTDQYTTTEPIIRVETSRRTKIVGRLRPEGGQWEAFTVLRNELEISGSSEHCDLMSSREPSFELASPSAEQLFRAIGIGPMSSLEHLLQRAREARRAGELDIADHYSALAEVHCRSESAPCQEPQEWLDRRFGRIARLPSAGRGLVLTPLGLGTRALSLRSDELFESY